MSMKLVLTNHTPAVYYESVVGAWLSLVERSVWDREVASSNLSAPTKILPTYTKLPLLRVGVFVSYASCTHSR